MGKQHRLVLDPQPVERAREGARTFSFVLYPRIVLGLGTIWRDVDVTSLEFGSFDVGIDWD